MCQGSLFIFGDSFAPESMSTDKYEDRKTLLYSFVNMSCLLGYWNDREELFEMFQLWYWLGGRFCSSLANRFPDPSSAFFFRSMTTFTERYTDNFTENMEMFMHARAICTRPLLCSLGTRLKSTGLNVAPQATVTTYLRCDAKGEPILTTSSRQPNWLGFKFIVSTHKDSYGACRL